LDDFFMFGMASVFEARGENAMGDDPLQRKTTEKGKIILRHTLCRKVKGMEIVQVQKVKGKGSKGGKIGRPEKSVSSEQKKIALRAAYLGMPEDRVAVLCGFSCGNPAGWGAYLSRHPDFKMELESARVTGEVEMQGRVLDAGNGWQGSAWLLERTRGYVARASLEHTGKGGKELSISGNLLGAFGGQSK
jgi:hypothetical protein